MEKSHPVYSSYGADSKGNVYNKHNKKMSLHDNGNGYFYIGVFIDGKLKVIRASRFIYECFNGVIEKYKVIDHIDGDKKNNAIDNLQKITQSENCKKHFTKFEKTYVPAMKVEATNVDTGEKKEYKSMSSAAKDLKIQSACVRRICEGLQHMSISKEDEHKYSFKKI